MSNLTDMFDSRFIPQMIESPVDSIIRKIEGDTETYICNRLMELNIDKDILMNQTQEITRLNQVIAEYERLEEQGLLLRLKAGVGSKVYDVEGNEYIVKHFTYYSYFEPHFEYEAKDKEGIIWRFKDIHFGRFVFLTKEEAEQALKQMGE